MFMAAWQDRYWTSSDGLRLHYRDYAGPPDRPPILCLPGLTRNARDYEGLADRLAGEWRVILVEFRGRGESAYAKDPMTYVPLTYFQDVEALLAELKIERFVAVGTSLGGIVTMLLAATERDKLAGVVLNDVGPEIEPAGLARIRGYVGKGSWYATWMHAARALASTGRADIAEEIAPLLADREWWVRLAAKESLQQLGDEVWSVLVPYLDHEDGFARNGAAEVLQNIGVLDSLIVLEAVTARPSAAKIEMLRKIASAGGTRMTAALLERVDARTRPRVRALLQTLGLEPAGVES